MAKYIQVGNTYKLMKDNNEVFSLKNYKNAKAHLEKLEAILNVINKSMATFKYFEAYKAASNCLETLRAEKIMVEVSVAKCKAILHTKGKL